jgi:hypothetical protein
MVPRLLGYRGARLLGAIVDTDPHNAFSERAS